MAISNRHGVPFKCCHLCHLYPSCTFANTFLALYTRSYDMSPLLEFLPYGNHTYKLYSFIHTSFFHYLGLLFGVLPSNEQCVGSPTLEPPVMTLHHRFILTRGEAPFTKPYYVVVASVKYEYCRDLDDS